MIGWGREEGAGSGAGWMMGGQLGQRQASEAPAAGRRQAAAWDQTGARRPAPHAASRPALYA